MTSPALMKAVVKAIEDASHLCTRKCTPAHSVPTAASAPIRAAMTPSSMNGNWMKKLEAPTSRMISVSLDRLIADSRIVVVIKSTAVSPMIAASPAVIHEARFMTRKNGSRVLR